MNLVLLFIAVGAAGYLLGAIPFSLLVGKLFFKLDLREQGSGNLGATNTFRVLGGRAALAVLVLDGLKGATSVFMAMYLVPESTYTSDVANWAIVLGIFAAIFGHAFSPYIKFKGGKGVATAAGALFALMPLVACVELAIFIVVILITRYVSLGSIIIAMMYPILVVVFYPHVPFIVFACVTAAMVVWLHRSNISRLRAGTEPKISFRNRGSSKRSTD